MTKKSTRSFSVVSPFLNERPAESDNCLSFNSGNKHISYPLSRDVIVPNKLNSEKKVSKDQENKQILQLNLLNFIKNNPAFIKDTLKPNFRFDNQLNQALER